jgi:hypothetical protein
MKALKYMNSVAIGIPLLLLLSYPFYNQSSVIFAALSMIVTGNSIHISLKIISSVHQ